MTSEEVTALIRNGWKRYKVEQRDQNCIEYWTDGKRVMRSDVALKECGWVQLKLPGVQ